MGDLEEAVATLGALAEIEEGAGAVRVIGEVANERVRHHEDYEFTPEYDDRHSTHEWAWLLAHRCHALSCPWPDEFSPEPDPRRALIEVAAIAVAAIESLDRRAALRYLEQGALDQARRAVEDMGSEWSTSWVYVNGTTGDRVAIGSMEPAPPTVETVLHVARDSGWSVEDDVRVERPGPPPNPPSV